MTDNQKPGEWLSSGEFACLLGKPTRTIERWVAQAFQQGKLKITKTPGGQYRIPRKVAMSFILK